MWDHRSGGMHGERKILAEAAPGSLVSLYYTLPIWKPPPGAVYPLVTSGSKLTSRGQYAATSMCWRSRIQGRTQCKETGRVSGNNLRVSHISCIYGPRKEPADSPGKPGYMSSRTATPEILASLHWQHILFPILGRSFLALEQSAGSRTSKAESIAWGL